MSDFTARHFGTSGRLMPAFIGCILDAVAGVGLGFSGMFYLLFQLQEIDIYNSKICTNLVNFANLFCNWIWLYNYSTWINYILD